jgi:hypothetical protein
LFYDEANLILALRDDSPAYDIPGFTRVPWEQMGLLDLNKASRPVPPNGYDEANLDVRLYWAPSFTGVSRNVYFGTDHNSVADANTLSEDFKGNQTAADFDPGLLAENKQYFWRVDEVDSEGAATKGDLWSFATQGMGPKAYWRFNEGSGGTITDSSGGSTHNGTMINMDESDWVTGKHCFGLEFDGVDDYVEITGYQGIVGSGSRTVSAWIKTSTTGHIISWGDIGPGEKWLILVQGYRGAIGVLVESGYIIGTTDLRDGQWHHIAAVLEDDGSPNADEIILYVDGVIESISLVGAEPINTSGIRDIRLGVWDVGDGDYFNGVIDEVRVYDRVLSDEEIWLLYLANAISGDLYLNGAINLQDFALLASHWLEVSASDGLGDLNCDGRVDASDLAVLTEEWLQSLP